MGYLEREQGGKEAKMQQNSGFLTNFDLLSLSTQMASYTVSRLLSTARNVKTREIRKIV
jgi:hypothetical protein